MALGQAGRAFFATSAAFLVFELVTLSRLSAQIESNVPSIPKFLLWIAVTALLWVAYTWFVLRRIVPLRIAERTGGMEPRGSAGPWLSEMARNRYSRNADKLYSSLQQAAGDPPARPPAIWLWRNPVPRLQWGFPAVGSLLVFVAFIALAVLAGVQSVFTDVPASQFPVLEMLLLGEWLVVAWAWVRDADLIAGWYVEGREAAKAI